jgi:hypothetical protein
MGVKWPSLGIRREERTHEIERSRVMLPERFVVLAMGGEHAPPAHARHIFAGKRVTSKLWCTPHHHRKPQEIDDDEGVTWD